MYVEARQLPTLPSQLQLVGANPNARYVMVSVRVQGLDNGLVPWLAHELWHAVEIAGAPEVRDATSLRRFYERIGGSFRAGGIVQLETSKAQDIQITVLDEMRRPGAEPRKGQSR